jgi:HEAT repeat protein
MNLVITVVSWGIGGAVVLLAAAMVFHLLARAVTRSRAERQRELDGILLSAAQSGAAADEVVARLRRTPPAYARRSIVHAIRSLGEAYRPYLAYIYENLGFVGRAIHDLQSYSWARRAEAALEVGALKRTEAVNACLDLLRDPHPEVRVAASRALSDLGVAGTIRPMLEAIPICTRWAISDAVDLVRNFGEAAGPELLAVLAQSTSRQARLAAIEALGEIQFGEAYAVIEPFLLDPDLEFRVAATRALGRIGGHGVFEALGRALRDPAWQVRAAAARSLGLYRHAQAVALLEQGLSDPAWWVRINSAEALGQQDAQGAEALRKSLQSTDAFARDLAAQMLQQIPPQQPGEAPATG